MLDDFYYDNQAKSYRPDCKDCKKYYARRYASKLRLTIVHQLGSKCKRCGFADWRALQIDHCNGGGNAHRKRIGSGTKYYQSMLEDLSLYQLLCANCNWIKKYERNEVPHSK